MTAQPHKNEVPGNVLATKALAERIMLKTGVAVHTLAQYLEDWEAHDVVIKSLRFSCKHGATGEWLCVVTADTADGPKVAFHGADNLVAAVEGLRNRVKNGNLKWKDDEYAG